MLKKENFIYLFVFFYPILPEYFALDLGTNLPLLTVSRILLIILFVSCVFKGDKVLKKNKSLNIISIFNKNKNFLLYFILITISNIAHINENASLKNLILIILEQAMLLICLIKRVDLQNSLEKCLKCLVSGSLIMGIGGIIETVSGTNLFYSLSTASRELTMANYTRLSVTRAEATFGHPISFSVYLLLVIPFIMYFFELTKKMFFKFCLIISIVSIFATISRASILILSVYMIIMVSLKPKNERILYYRMFGLALLPIIFVAILFPSLTNLFSQIVFSVLNILGFSFEVSDFGRNESGSNSRIYQLQLVSQTISQKPLFGFGVGYVYNNVMIVSNGNKYFKVTSIDNEYLLALIEGGIVSLIGKITLYISTWLETKRTRKNDNLSKAFFFSFSMYFIAIFTVCELTSARMLWIVFSLFCCYKNILLLKKED
jgi:hypothetical protein